MKDQHARLAGIRLFEDALPEPLFHRLRDAVRSLGNEKLDGNATYATTFWFPRGAPPTNVAEEAIVALQEKVGPPDTCIGSEWWLGRLRYGKKLNFHFDRDLALSRKTGESVFPILGSILYLNAYPSSPTVLLDQVPGPDGKTKVPEVPKLTTSVAAIPNHYVVYPGNLRHGVIPDTGKPHPGAEPGKEPSELRLTLLVNYWHRRPSAPVCCDYDGTIYAGLRERVAA